MTEAEIVEGLRAMRDADRKVRVLGGGVSALPPRDGAVSISTSGFAGVVDLRPDDLVVTVRAGTPLVELDAALRTVGCRLPLRPWDVGGRGTVGGAVAAAADGLTAREGFRWRDLVLGVRAALPSGDVVYAGASVVKSVAGLDVSKATVGSRGTLAVILCLNLRIERLPALSRSLASPDLKDSEVASYVALIAALGMAPRGLVVSPCHAPGTARVDVLLEGGATAVGASVAVLRAAGFGEIDDPERRWAALTADASRPPPSGLFRRVGRCSRRDPLARAGVQRSGGWVADILRQRITWVDRAPPPPPDPASAALFDRVRRAFDPDGLLAPGRGFGAP